MRVAAMIALGLRASIFLCVLVLGLRASIRDATVVFRSPYLLVSSVVSMYVMMPAVAIALATSFELHPAVKIALIALALSPVPPFLPQQVLKAGGAAPYTIGLLVASTVLSVVVIPVALEFFHRMLDVPLRLSGGQLTNVLLFTTVLPLALGMIIRRALPHAAERAMKPLSLVANVVLVLAALAVVLTYWRQLISLVGDGTLLVLIVFSIVGIVVGRALGGPSREQHTVLALSTASRHPAVAMVIAHATFPTQQLVAPAVLWALVTGAVVGGMYRARVKRRHEVLSLGGAN